MKETDSPDRTPEQLLQILEMGIEMQKARRKTTQRNRAVFLMLGIVFILTGAAVALLVLSQLLHESQGTLRGTPVAVQN